VLKSLTVPLAVMGLLGSPIGLTPAGSGLPQSGATL
jgi:hypothetical protein